MSAPFFDTNILIDWLNDSPKAIAELGRYKKHRISRVVWTELLAGVPIEERDTLQHTLSSFEVVEIDARIATAAADMRYRSPMKLMDAYIWATAQVNGAILITRNIKDFPEKMPGIRVPYATP